jgi:hypothetical protein
MSEPSPTPAPVKLDVKPKTLAMIVGGGLVVGTLLVLTAVLPAEYNVDPLGVGKLSGISALWAPDEKSFKANGSVAPAYVADQPRRRDRFEIPLGASDWKEAALEYKVAMKPGQVILYSWEAFDEDGKPATVPVEFDFHGHTLSADGKAMTVAEYHKASGLKDQGALQAPFDGVHGWYFKNHANGPVTIRLDVEGFYELIPKGKEGNLFGVKPMEEAPR